MTADIETRVRVLEEQVEILHRALVLAAVGAKPAVEWADAQMKKAREGEFRYSDPPGALCGVVKTDDTGENHCVFLKQHEGKHSWDR
jgi:hypothetical protein